MKSPSLSECDEKYVKPTGRPDAVVSTKEVDTAAELASGSIGVLDPKAAARIRYVADL